MKVKIAYTVELDEVETEISEIISKATFDLDFAYQETARIQLDLNTNVGVLGDKIEKLNIVKSKILKALQVIEDCQSILEGLKQTREQLEEKKDEIQNG